MRTQYLYLKIHNKTGLKYLGKTYKNPFKYRGSGIRWTNHLRVHGNDVTTEILKECNSKEELIHWGVYYSNLWDVVNNNQFANLQKETGDGRDPDSVMGQKNPNYGNKWNEEQRKKLSEYRKQFTGEKNPVYGKKRNDLSERNKKPKYWMNDGKIDKLVLVEEYEYYKNLGFVRGRLFSITNKLN